MGPLPLSGHEIALNCASFTFMVPFAISAAAAVRVGQAIGRKAPNEAAAAGWTAILLGAACMATFSAVIFLMPHAIARAFTPTLAVIAAAIPLLLVAAIFQFFDGLQITATGALRGAGNTHAGLIVQIIGYWVVGLPVGASSASACTTVQSASGSDSAPDSSSPASPSPPPGAARRSLSPPEILSRRINPHWFA